MNKFTEYEKNYSRISLKLHKIDHHLLMSKMIEQKNRTGASWNRIVLMALYQYYGIVDIPKGRKNVQKENHC